MHTVKLLFNLFIFTQLSVFGSSLYFNQKCNNTKPIITIGGLFMTFDFLENERNCLPAAQIAVEDINDAGILLPDYTLRLKSGSSMCNEPLSFFYINQFLSPSSSDICADPPAIAIMGPLCGHECDITGPLMKMYNSVQVSYACGAASKEKRVDGYLDSYSNLFRMEVDFLSFSKVRIAFLLKMKWRRVALLYHSGRSSISYLDDQQRLLAALAASNISVLRVENFIYSAAENLDRIKAAEARIIFFAVSQSYTKEATIVGCDAYKRGIHGYRYVWISIAYTSPDWWVAFSNFTDCTLDQISSVFSGMLYVGQDSLVDEEMKSNWTGKSLKDLKRSLNDRNILSGYEYVPSCYDNVVILSHALNKTEEYLRSINSTVLLPNFYENRRLVADTMVRSLKQVDYIGFRGRIQFEFISNEAIVDFTAMFQDLNGVRKTVFRLPYNGTDGYFTNNSIFWGTKNGEPPLDGPVIVIKRNTTAFWLRTLAHVISAIGLLVSLILAAVIFIRMNELAFRATSPRLNLLVLAGTVMLYSSLPFVTDVPAQLPVYCSIRFGLVLFGVCLVFGSLFGKAFRVYMIFTQFRQILNLRDWKIFLFVGTWTVVNMGAWISWTIWDPYFVVKDVQVKRPISSDGYDQRDIVEKTYTNKCVSQYSNQFTYAFVSVQGLMMTFGCFLAFSTRNVSYAEINDSKSIASSIYVVTIVTIITAAVSVVSTDVNLTYGVSIAATTIGTAVSQSLIFYRCLQNLKSLEVINAKVRQWRLMGKFRPNSQVAALNNSYVGNNVHMNVVRP